MSICPHCGGINAVHIEARHTNCSSCSIARRKHAFAIVAIESGYNTHQALGYNYRHWHDMFGEGAGAVRHMFAHHILKPERVPLEANLWGTPKSSGAFSTLFEDRIRRAKRTDDNA